MNKFELNFFNKYIPEGQEIKGIIHIHFMDIFSKIFLWLSMGAIIPSFLYYISERIQSLVPFYVLEIFLIFVFIKIIYDIFDWYNDVWIMTDLGIIQLTRSLLKKNTNSVDYDKIEGVEVEQNGVADKFLKKGELIIHKFGNDTLTLSNALNPYKSVDLIEEMTEEALENLNSKSEHFDVIMDALGGVVETYLEKKDKKSDKEIEIDRAIEEVERLKGSIDLR